MYIASASTSIKFHDFPSGNVVHNYQPGTKVEGSIKSISWSKDGNWLVVVPNSGLTEILSVKDQLKLLKTIQNVDEPTCATFQNTTKKFIGMGTKNGLVLIFDVKAKHAKKRFPRANSQITHVEFTARDSHCVAACKNGDVLVYNNITNSPPSLMRVPKSASISCLKTSKLKQNLILGGSNEGFVCVWDNNTNRSKFLIEAHKAPVNSLTFSPINSDLIVTTGSDRLCRFFDIVDNKCIASLAVENSITSIDFSPDGTYLVMASQNGHIFIFDSRNIQEAVHSFQAHSSAIKHLSFQNASSSNNTSSCNLSVDTIPIPSEENLNVRSKRTSDMFRTFIPSNETTDGLADVGNKRKSVASMEGGDSFLAALGVEQNNTADSVKNDDSVFHRYVPPKLPSTIGETAEVAENNNEIICEKTELQEIKQNQYTSTPVFFRNDQNQIEINVTSSDIKSVVKDIVKDEKNNFSVDLQSIRQEIKDLGADLKNEVKNEATVLRRMMMNTQMAMVKESLKMEDWCNKLREELNGENGRDINILLDENEKLKRRIEFLEEQLKNACSKSDSGSII